MNENLMRPSGPGSPCPVKELLLKLESKAPATNNRLCAECSPPAKARIDSKRGDGPGCPAEQSSAEDAMSRPKRGAQKFHDMSSRCHPEQSEGSMHSAVAPASGPPSIRTDTLWLDSMRHTAQRKSRFHSSAITRTRMPITIPIALALLVLSVILSSAPPH